MNGRYARPAIKIRCISSSAAYAAGGGASDNHLGVEQGEHEDAQYNGSANYLQGVGGGKESGYLVNFVLNHCEPPKICLMLWTNLSELPMNEAINKKP